jgi:hypothetical protein
MNKLNLRDILDKANLKSNLFNMYIDEELNEEELIKQFEMLSESNIVIYFLLQVIKDLYTKVDIQVTNPVSQKKLKEEQESKAKIETELVQKKAELEIQAKLEAERLATLEKARVVEEMLKQDRYKVGKLPIIGAASEIKLIKVGIVTVKDFLNNLDLVVKTTGYKIETLKPAIDKAKLLLEEIKL